MEPTLPVLPRLDRLDRLLELLEEKHGRSRIFRSTMANDDDNDHKDCKTLSSALHDVHYKGTLIDRLALLENRVLKLSLEMEEGNTSSSSSSTAYATKGHEDNEIEIEIKKYSKKSNGKRLRRAHFKWMGWFAMRC